MPRKPTNINPKHLAVLKTKVLDTARITLNRSVDCDKLAEFVSTQTKTYINGITFKRLYGFTKYPFNPSVQTLDILCRFVGFDNWHHFEQSLYTNHPVSHQELDILLSFYDFDFINTIEPHSGGIQSMSRKIALRLREDVTAFKRAIPVLATKKYAQIFFTEHFPDYDNLCTYYYLLYKEYVQRKHTPEAQIFGYAMLFLRAFWQQSKKQCKTYLTEINRQRLSADIHPYVVGRYFACNMLFERYFGLPEKVSLLYNEYLQFSKNLPKEGTHFLDFPASEYIVSEALLLCKEYQKCLTVVRQGFDAFPVKMEFARKGYYRQMQLLGLIARKYLSPGFNMMPLLEKINPEGFYFISKKHFSAYYYFAWFLHTQNSRYLRQATAVSKSTGNRFFINMFLKHQDIKTYS